METSTTIKKTALVPRPSAADQQAAGQSEQDRHGEGLTGEAAQRAPQPFDVDLQAGQEQQHAQAQVAENLNRRVKVDPAQHGRSDHDSGHDLQHGSRDRQPRNESGDQRHHHRYQGDDQQTAKRDGRHR